MLETLTIRQIALIDDVTIGFHDGIQVLTGETGAGKSIVVDSVNLILGGRADRDLIRTGCEKASVEAVFNAADNVNVREFLHREGIEYDGQTVTVYREFSASGKNICRVCGMVIPVSRLRDLAALLMDLHGQSEHQFLIDTDKQLMFLDQTGDDKHRELLQRIASDYEKFRDVHRAYAKLVKENENRESRMRSLQRDLDELRKARIMPNEAMTLLERRKKLSETEKQNTLLTSASEILSGTENSSSGLSQIREVDRILKVFAEKDESFADISKRCESAYFELEDIAYQISQRTRLLDLEPDTLEKIESRLDLIHRLERKYTVNADEMQSLLQKMEDEYLHLTELEDKIKHYSAEHKRLLAAYRKTARELTLSRRGLACVFEQNMMKELNDLGMAGTRFQIEFKPNETGHPLMPTPKGDDRIEFMISPNDGEPLKSLGRIASGGELSRMMLAVKTLESAHSGVESMVFDEIDTGISGRMAQVVAEKMIRISREHQVICVTHLPQIAAAADYHYLVKKTVSDGRTHTSVLELDRTGRTEEIARMISGADGNSHESNIYAARLLSAADRLKQNAVADGNHR